MTITPRRGWFHLELGELWRFRELGLFLVWRDIKVRYKQTVIGAAWAIIQPIVMMLVFTAIFGRGSGRLAPPPGISPSIFYFSALLPWSYFSQALQVSTGSVVSSQQIVTRVYFPRLILPLEGTFPGFVDFTMAFIVMAVLMISYGTPFTARLFVMVPLMLVAALAAFGAGMWLSASNALYRDIREGVPFAIQVLMFMSVLLPAKAVVQGGSTTVRALVGLNPMAGVIEGFRWAIIGPYPCTAKKAAGAAICNAHFPFDLLLPGLVVTGLLLITGVLYFRRIEDVIVDVV